MTNIKNNKQSYDEKERLIWGGSLCWLAQAGGYAEGGDFLKHGGQLEEEVSKRIRTN